jgi:hypothetical protein
VHSVGLLYSHKYSMDRAYSCLNVPLVCASRNQSALKGNAEPGGTLNVVTVCQKDGEE